MTAASPKTSPSALRSPLPPSITHSTRPSSVSPRESRSCSSSVQSTAFSVEPSRKPTGTLPPSRVIARATITVCPATTTPSMNSATTSSPSSRRVRYSCSRCRVRRTTVRLTALLLLLRLRRPPGGASRLASYWRVDTPASNCCIHPRGQRVPVAKRRHRGQRRFPAGHLPHAGAAHLQAPAPERELRRRRPPVMMGALHLMPALGARQRHGLLAKQFVQRGQPLRMDPREQVLTRGRHPGEHRLHQGRQPQARLILRLPSLPSLCSRRHWRLLGPGCGDRLSWSTRFSRRPGSRRYSVLKFNRDRDISARDRRGGDTEGWSLPV